MRANYRVRVTQLFVAKRSVLVAQTQLQSSALQESFEGGNFLRPIGGHGVGYRDCFRIVMSKFFTIDLYIVHTPNA